MPYRVEFVSRSGKDVKRLDRQTKERVMTALADLSVVPRPHGIEQLGKGIYRLRAGDFRIVYEVMDKQKAVVIYKVQKRGEVYRG